jgi:putative ABC transport system permease protein
MFLTYLRRELRRRMRQAIFIALGLALGIGLVITVTAASSGVSNSQGTVLHSLYGVGTDVTVTQSPTAGSGGPTRFGFGGGNSGSKPSAGTSFSRSVLTSGGLGPLPSSDVAKISGLKDVSATAGALTLTDLKLSGTINAGGSGGGSAGSGTPGTRSSIKSSSFSVTGVDLANGSLGPLSSGTITSGHNFSSADSAANVAVVDANYAKAENLKTGSTFKVAGTKFTVIGIVSVAQGSVSADVYIPLARAQALASMKNEVNTVYVSAASAADITRPLCCQGVFWVFFGVRSGVTVQLRAVAGRRVDPGPGVAWPKSRCSGCKPAALAAESFPGCPPGPSGLAAAGWRASAWRRPKMASLTRRLRDRSASLDVLPSASLRS